MVGARERQIIFFIVRIQKCRVCIWLPGKRPCHASAVIKSFAVEREERETIQGRTERYFSSASSLATSNLLFVAGESFPALVVGFLLSRSLG
jgi:hypothetical protein